MTGIIWQSLEAGKWDKDFMLRQLSYSGTLEVTEVRKAGLNVTHPLAAFLRTYKICIPKKEMLQMRGDTRERTRTLLTAATKRELNSRI